MASRYWVGGNGTWDATVGTKWALTSGGAGGQTVPVVAVDNVFLDQNNTVTIGSGYVAGARIITHSNGTLKIDAETLDCNSYSAGAGSTARALVLTSGTLRVSANSGSISLATAALNFTFTKGTGTFDIYGGTAGGTPSISLAGWTVYKVTLRAGSTSIINTNSGVDTLDTTGILGGITLGAAGNNMTFGTVTVVDAAILTLTGNCTITSLTTNGSMILGANQTITTLSINGSTSATKGIIMSSARLTQRTLTVTTLTCTKTDIADIIAAGGANWNLSAEADEVGNGGNNTGITFAAGIDKYWHSGNGDLMDSKYYTQSNGGGSATTPPNLQDTAIFDANSFDGAGCIITNTCLRLPGINFSNTSNSPTWDNNAASATLYGSCYRFGVMADITGPTYLSSLYGLPTIRYIESTNIALGTLGCGGTSNTRTLEIVGTARTGIITITNGKLDIAGGNLICPSVVIGANSIDFGEGTIELTGTGAVLPITASTVTAGTGTIKLSNTSATAKTMAWNSKTVPNIWLAGGTYTISNGFTCNNFTADYSGAAHTITLTAGITITVNGVLYMAGSAGLLISIISGTAGTHAHFGKASGIVVARYLSIKDNYAEGGATFYSGPTSTLVSGTSGWSASSPTANDYRSAVVTGASEGTPSSDNRSAVITGYATSNSNRNAKVTGKDIASANRNAAITGSAASTDTSDYRNATIKGKDIRSDTRPSKISGKDTASEGRLALLIGKDVLESNRSAIILGQDIANANRDSKITGYDTFTNDRQAIISGKDIATVGRDANIWGKNTSSDNRSAIITGYQAVQAVDSRLATIIGSDTTEAFIDAVIKGSANWSFGINASIKGSDTSTTTRPAIVKGKDTKTSNRSAVITGRAISTASRRAKVRGSDTSSSSRSATIHGGLQVVDSRIAKIIGKDTTDYFIDAVIRGSAAWSYHIPATIHGKDTGTSNIKTIIHGKDTSSSSRGAIIKGQPFGPIYEIDVKVTTRPWSIQITKKELALTINTKYPISVTASTRPFIITAKTKPKDITVKRL
jgi:hypothetical protein